MRLGPLVRREQAGDDRQHGGGDHDQPDDAAATGAAAVLLDELLEVALALGLEVRVLRLVRLERMQQQRGQADRTPRGVALETERRGGRADERRVAPRHPVAVVDVDDHDGDVVGRAVVEALLDEPVGGALRGAHGLQDRGDLVFGDVAAESVGAEQPAIAGQHVVDGGVDLGGRVDIPEHAHQHRAARVDGRLLRGDAARVDEALHEGVVGADLLEQPVAEAVDAGVADVRHRDLVADPQDAADGRPHAGQLAVLEHGLGEQRVRGDQRGLQRELGVLGEEYSMSASATRLAAIADATSPPACPPIPSATRKRCVPAYPESWLLDRIFPTCETAALVGVGVVATGYRRSSKLVVPIVTGVPSGTGTGTVTRDPSRKVPFVDSRSWITHWSSQSIRRAWCVEV